MLLLRQYLRRDLRRLADNGVRLKVIGRRDRLPDGLGAGDRRPPKPPPRPAPGSTLNVALDYSARDAIAQRGGRAGSATTRRRAPRSAACSPGRATAPGATSTC